jgi:hypothetical protein
MSNNLQHETIALSTKPVDGPVQAQLNLLLAILQQLESISNQLSALHGTDHSETFTHKPDCEETNNAR